MVKNKTRNVRTDYARFTCPIQNAVELIGDRWTLFIIREFNFGKEEQGFNDLLRALKPISSRTLSLKLKKLEKYKIVKRRLITIKPIRVEYSLTDIGKSLKLSLQKMGDW